LGFHLFDTGAQLRERFFQDIDILQPLLRTHEIQHPARSVFLSPDEMPERVREIEAYSISIVVAVANHQ
jgi:hypothetical protein